MAEAARRFRELLKERRTSDAPCFVTDGETLSYAVFFRRASGLARRFASLGVKPGERIVVSLPNSPELATAYFAGLLGGYTIVPVSPDAPTDDQAYIKESSQPSLVVDDPALFKNLPEHDLEFSGSADGLLAIFYTSGTTRQPKAVCQTVEKMLGNAAAFNRLTGLDASCRMYHVMPMTYMAGFLNTLLCPLVAGGTVVMGTRFSAASAMRFWELARREDVNTMWLSPTMLSLLTRLNRSEDVPRWTREHLRNLFVGTAPLPPAVKELFEKVFGVRCLESYGMTEVMLVSSNHRNLAEKSGSVGTLLEGVEIRTRGPAGEVLPSNEPGELYLKTDFALEGYRGVEERPVDDDGWFATGDVARTDEDGHLFITGRVKELILHGGVNVSPRAVEEVLLRFPGVADAAVVGKPHPMWGEEVVAFIVSASEWDEAVLTAYCKEHLPADAVPTVFNSMDALPRNANGKILKNALQEMA